MKFKYLLPSLSIVAAAGIGTLVQAQPTNATAAAPATSATAGGMQISGAMTEGEVRKVDKDNKKITLRHGEIKNLEMPGMTMVFQVKDPAMLDMVKQGDKVMFRAEKANGALMVTEIQPAK